MFIACLALILLVFFRKVPDDVAFALDSTQTSPPAGVVFPEEQQMIEKYQTILDREDLDVEQRESIQEKLQMLLHLIEMRSLTEPAFLSEPAALELPEVQQDNAVQEGIFEGDEGLFQPGEARIENYWQGVMDGKILQAFAGAAGNDAMQGMIIVNEVSNDRRDASFSTYTTPTRSGSIRVTAVENGVLHLTTGEGLVFHFDLSDKVFIE